MKVDAAGDTTIIEEGRLLAGRYRLLFKVGEGGLAEVYRARDQRLDRIVAVKLLRPQFTSDQQSRRRFTREAKAAAALSHPNIADVYDYGEAPDGSMFIVMEYVEGQTLYEMLGRRGRLPAEEAISIAQDVCSALGAAHAKGLVHRDVKPQNVMVTPDGSACLTDFGIVKALSESRAALTQAGMTLGTAAYLSPEQATGGPVSPASDIYALGCVMYEMLSGVPPFSGKNATEVAYRQVWEQPVPIAASQAPDASLGVRSAESKEDGDIPHSAFRIPHSSVLPLLDKIVMRCLEKEPEKRYPDTDSLAAELGRARSALDRPTQVMRIVPAKTTNTRGASRKRVAPVRVGGLGQGPVLVDLKGIKAKPEFGLVEERGPLYSPGARDRVAKSAPVRRSKQSEQVHPYLNADLGVARSGRFARIAEAKAGAGIPQSAIRNPQPAVRPYVGSVTYERAGEVVRKTSTRSFPLGMSVAGARLSFVLLGLMLLALFGILAWQNREVISEEGSNNAALVIPTNTAVAESTQAPEPTSTVPLGQIVVEPPSSPPPAPWPTSTPQSGPIETEPGVAMSTSSEATDLEASSAEAAPVDTSPTQLPPAAIDAPAAQPEAANVPPAAPPASTPIPPPTLRPDAPAPPQAADMRTPLERAVDEALAANPEVVKEYLEGKKTAFLKLAGDLKERIEREKEQIDLKAAIELLKRKLDELKGMNSNG